MIAILPQSGWLLRAGFVRAAVQHSSVISAERCKLGVERCKLGVGQFVTTALFIVATATSAKLPPGQYVPADDTISIYLSI